MHLLLVGIFLVLNTVLFIVCICRMSTAQVLVTAITTERTYNGAYDPDVTCGETMRNICINLNIDPDQVGGVITNVQFYRVLPSEVNLGGASASDVAATSITSCALQSPDVQSRALQHWSPVPEMQLITAARGRHLHLVVKELE